MNAKELSLAGLWCLDNPDWSVEFQFNPELGSMSLTRGNTVATVTSRNVAADAVE